MKQYRSTIIAFFKNKENSTRKTSIRHRRNTQRTISRSLAAHNQAGFVDSFREACNKLSIKQAELLEKLCNKLLIKLKVIEDLPFKSMMVGLLKTFSTLND